MKNYVFATIKLPLEIKTDGSIETHHDRIAIQFENCDTLPEKQNSNANYAFLMNNLMELMNHQDAVVSLDENEIEDNELEEEEEYDLDDELEEEYVLDDNEIQEGSSEITATFTEDIDKDTQNNILLFIKKDELERRANRVQNNNITFKKKRYNINRFSAKRR
jgi:hypothetical protein